MILSRETAVRLPTTSERPRYDRDAQRNGIVHFGSGAFHRGHQAVYTDDAMNDGDRDWRIVGVSLRSPDTRDALEPQDGLYTVIERAGNADRVRLISAIDRILVAPEDPAAVVAALADPGIHVVTLTVTEKGYYRDPATNCLQRDHPAIAAELAGGPPTTLFGFLARAISQRRLDGSGPLTLVSCDNLPANGRLLCGLLDEYLSHGDPDVRDWARDSIACVDTMVDRIVPAVDEQTRSESERLLGMTDRAVIVTEPFRQWIIEDAFAGPRPRWEAGGAQFVRDVAPFELAKLRLLNGSHSTLAYIGLQLGLCHVHQAVAEPVLNAFLVRQMINEIAPTLPPAEGQPNDEYIATILRRFANDRLPHRLAQIASDGSQKMPQRLIGTVVERMQRGLESPCHLLSLAAWLGFTRLLTPGHASDVTDPMAARFTALWQTAPGDAHHAAAEVVDRVVWDFGIFPDGFADSEVLMNGLRSALADWLAMGSRACLTAANQAG